MDIPLTFKYTLPINVVTLDVLAGPSFSFKLFGDSEMKVISISEVIGLSTVQNNSDNRFNYGFNFGFGTTYKSIMVNIVADLGFSKLMELEYYTQKVRSNSLRLSLGYKF